jgi:uncharacterized protein (DUF58 family)
VRRAGGVRIEGYALLVGAGLVAALALRRPELVAVAAPLALLLVLGLGSDREPNVSVQLTVDSERTIEGADVDAVVALRTDRAIERLDVVLDLPSDVRVVDGDSAFALRLARGEERELPLVLRCDRWGRYDLGEAELRARGALRLVLWEGRTGQPRRLRVYPRQEQLTRLVSPAETQAFTGSEVARIKGDGIEYADIRDYVPGDRLRAINWRASARRGSLVVNEQHPERNTDVVLFVDSFADVRRDGRSTLVEAVRAAATLAERYLERRDRVGLVAFGGVLRWLQPGMGAAWRYRVIETLLETDVEPTYTWRDVNIIPGRILPPKSLVVALTPLVDARFVAALEDLRARGFDILVVEVDPTPLVTPGRGEAAALAHRLWQLEREVLRARIEALGIATALVGDDASLEAALEGVRTYRRHAKLARA